MENIKITAIGNSGSGKTSYLLALYYKMLTGVNGYSLITDDNTDFMFRTLYTRLRNSSLKREGRFPPTTPTDKCFRYFFDLSQGFEKISTIEWIDYNGNITKNKIDFINSIVTDFYKSSNILLFVNGENFIYDSQIRLELKTDEDRIDNISFSNSFINILLKKYLDKNLRLPFISIVVTKYDLLKKYIKKDDDIIKIIEKSFTPLFDKKSNRINRNLNIIPVSLGDNISDNNFSGKLRPLNIHLPILFSTYFNFISNSYNLDKYIIDYLKNEISIIPYWYHIGNKISFNDVNLTRRG